MRLACGKLALALEGMMRDLCIDDGRVFFAGSLPRPSPSRSPILSRAGTNLPSFEPLMMFWAKGDQQDLEIQRNLARVSLRTVFPILESSVDSPFQNLLN